MDATDKFKTPVNAPWLDGDYKNTREGPFRTYGRSSDFTDPGPANTWRLMDESDFNLNDAALTVTMVGAFWFDFSGRFHNTSSGIAFVDGHSEYHQCRRPTCPVQSRARGQKPRLGLVAQSNFRAAVTSGNGGKRLNIQSGFKTPGGTERTSGLGPPAIPKGVGEVTFSSPIPSRQFFGGLASP